MHHLSPFRAELGRSCLRAVWHSTHGEGGKAMYLARMWRGEAMERHKRQLGNARDPLGSVAVSWKGKDLPFKKLEPLMWEVHQDDTTLVDWVFEREGFASDPVILVRDAPGIDEWALHVADKHQAAPHRLELLLWLAEPHLRITSVFVVSTGKVLTDLPVPPPGYKATLEKIVSIAENPQDVPERVLEVKKCSKCKFFYDCVPRVDDGRHEVWDVPRKQKATKLKSYFEGARYAADIDPSAPDVGSQPVIDREGLIEWVKEHLETPPGTPVYYLDFETVLSPKESGGFEMVPLQYSLHCDRRGHGALGVNIEKELLKGDVEGVEHTEFLSVKPCTVDERSALLESLLAATDGPGPIVVWNASFERSVLHGLQRAFPAHSAAVQDRIDRLVDLAVPFTKGLYKSPATYKSTSIKAVLPALCKDLHYPPSPISSGAQATLFMYQMYKGLLPVSTIQRMVPALLTYCRIDTAAMLGIASSLHVCVQTSNP